MTFSELNAIDFKNAIGLGGNQLLVDVREDYEFEDFNIGGVNIPFGDVLRRSAEFTKYDALLICCKSGKRSKTAAYHLAKKLSGINIITLSGGLATYT